MIVSSLNECDKRPNFFVVGAPKAATSSLWIYMGQHPDVYVPLSKEAHYFSFPEVTQAYYRRSYVTSEEEYASLYSDRAHQKAAGDFSPSYLFYPSAAKRIKAYRSDAKIVVILRNPVKRAISHYLMDRRLGYQHHPLSEILARPDEHEPFFKEYVVVGRYAPQIRSYLDVFGPEKVKVLFYEDLVKNPEKFISDAFEFVGVDPDFVPDFSESFNAYRMPRSKLVERFRNSDLWRGLRRFVPAMLKDKAKPLLDDTEKPDFAGEAPVLKTLFREDVTLLSTMLNRDLNSAWLGS